MNIPLSFKNRTVLWKSGLVIQSNVNGTIGRARKELFDILSFHGVDNFLLSPSTNAEEMFCLSDPNIQMADVFEEWVIDENDFLKPLEVHCLFRMPLRSLLFLVVCAMSIFGAYDLFNQENCCYSFLIYSLSFSMPLSLVATVLFLAPVASRRQQFFVALLPVIVIIALYMIRMAGCSVQEGESGKYVFCSFPYRMIGCISSPLPTTSQRIIDHEQYISSIKDAMFKYTRKMWENMNKIMPRCEGKKGEGNDVVEEIPSGNDENFGNENDDENNRTDKNEKKSENYIKEGDIINANGDSNCILNTLEIMIQRINDIQQEKQKKQEGKEMGEEFNEEIKSSNILSYEDELAQVIALKEVLFPFVEKLQEIKYNVDQYLKGESWVIFEEKMVQEMKEKEKVRIEKEDSTDKGVQKKNRERKKAVQPICRSNYVQRLCLRAVNPLMWLLGTDDISDLPFLGVFIIASYHYIVSMCLVIYIELINR